LIELVSPTDTALCGLFVAHLGVGDLRRKLASLFQPRETHVAALRWQIENIEEEEEEEALDT
jgi:hypothetical protein